MRTIYSENAQLGPQKPLSILQAMQHLPGLILVVVFFTVLAFFGGSLFGYNLSGLGWVVPLAIALLIVVKNFSKVSFPYVIWLPWGLFLFTQLLFVDYANLDPRVIPLQRTLQLLCPVFVGMAASTYRPTQIMTESFITLCRYLAFILLGVTALKTGILLTGKLPDVTGLAAEVMTVMLLCTLFINRYLLFKEKKDIQLWAMLAFVPFVAVTRTAIAVTLLTFPLAFGPMKLSRRLAVLVLIILLAIAAFYSPRVQKKMFYSGQGEMSDVMSADFSTSGRSSMWENMYGNIDDNLLLGFGTGAGETYVYKLTGQAGYPHNDWLLTLYDYGMLGVSLFALCLIMLLVHAKTRAKYCTSPVNNVLFLAGASAIVPFGMMMFTDNIMVYASYFGNLHFTILGLAYGALRAQYEQQATESLI